MNPIKSSARWVLQNWAKLGRAPGYLHYIVDQYGAQLSDPSLSRSIFKGGKIKCNLKDHVQNRIFFFGAYEPIEAYLFLHLIKPGDHIVDAGANIGFYSIISSAQLLETGQVYSFEPVPHNFRQLLKNIELSQADSIRVFDKGLWNKEDVLKFSLPQGMGQNAGSFSVGARVGGTQEVECEVTTLDQLVNAGEIEKVDLLKMDIEGAEWFALQGAIETLKKFRPTALIEINKAACQNLGYTSGKIDQIFLDLGYKIFFVGSTPEKSRYLETTNAISQGNVFYISPRHQGYFIDHWDHREVRKFFARN